MGTVTHCRYPNSSSMRSCCSGVVQHHYQWWPTLPTSSAVHQPPLPPLLLYHINTATHESQQCAHQQTRSNYCTRGAATTNTCRPRLLPHCRCITAGHTCSIGCNMLPVSTCCCCWACQLLFNKAAACNSLAACLG